MQHPMRNNTRLGGHLSERVPGQFPWRACLLGFVLGEIAWLAVKLMA